VEYCITREGLAAVDLSGDTVAVTSFFDDARGCRKFAQRLLRFAAGASRERLDESDDEVFFVLDGSATLVVAGTRTQVRSGTGAFVSRGTPWQIEADSGIEILSVLVHDPEPVAPGSSAVVDLEAEGRRSATAARQFTLGVGPAFGCPSATQFIGFVPPGRAPDHFHRYDEVIYILEGQGTLHIGGEVAALAPGVCVHLPARLVHSLANDGESEMQLLGVFRPGGSPAEAYYPDGTPATYPEES
jgi:mannose-6-phosphate isomerase-like protein (cupin superfamily)